MSREQLSKLMKRGHQLAKQMTGDYKVRLSLALRQAWKEFKNENQKGEKYTMATVKQIQYANDIKNELINILDSVEGLAKELENEGYGKSKKGVSRIIKGYEYFRKQVEELNTTEQAEKIINTFKNVLNNKSLYEKMFTIQYNWGSCGLFDPKLTIKSFIDNVLSDLDRQDAEKELNKIIARSDYLKK